MKSPYKKAIVLSVGSYIVFYAIENILYLISIPESTSFVPFLPLLFLQSIVSIALLVIPPFIIGFYYNKKYIRTSLIIIFFLSTLGFSIDSYISPKYEWNFVLIAIWLHDIMLPLAISVIGSMAGRLKHNEWGL